MYTFNEVLSETGGMASALFTIFGIFASIFNYYVYVMHFVHLLYFLIDEPSTEKSKFSLNKSVDFPKTLNKSQVDNCESCDSTSSSEEEQIQPKV